MCLVTDWKEPKVAEKDITVYKIVFVGTDGRIHADFHYNFIYVIGMLYETEMGTPLPRFSAWFDEFAMVGFVQKYGKDDYTVVTDGKAWAIEEGFHSMELGRINDVINPKHNSVMECIIPRGSKYYMDLSGLYVSNRIKPIKILRQWKSKE